MKKVSKKNIVKKGDASPAIPASRNRRARAAEKTAIRIVGMGGSAGGLEAFEQFFSSMPSDTGMAFVLVQHLDPTHKGIMAEIPPAADENACRTDRGRDADRGKIAFT